jgi:hypothetical protein
MSILFIMNQFFHNFIQVLTSNFLLENNSMKPGITCIQIKFSQFYAKENCNFELKRKLFIITNYN